MDANWRWLHEKSGYANCYEEGSWSTVACPSGADCAVNCAVEGVSQRDWEETYGITKTAEGVRVNFKTGGNVGSRFYMLDPSEKYKQFQLLNREITFDVDVSTLPCGMNGAVYFSEMAADGGQGASNKADARYGVGYCDAQCPRDVKFISGEANSEDWGASGGPMGKYGSCCAEMDLWEANSEASAFTAHPCALDGPYRCEGAECKTVCDMPGCDLNPYRMGDHGFYGPGSNFVLNTLKPFTIVTQFITTDGTDSGDLSEIRRFYIQDGKRIENSKATLAGLENQDVLSDATCTLDKKVFGENDTTAKFGGMKQMGEALSRGRGMTLVLSLWDDGATQMKWLDSADPAWEDPQKPGVTRGPCPAGAGDPSEVRQKYADAYVEYFNFKYGELDSTVKGQAQALPNHAQPAPKAPAKPVQVAPPPPEPVRVPAPTSVGSCCWGGCGGTCKGPSDWCANQENCEGPCNGQWLQCGAVLSDIKHHRSEVKRHRQLRGKEHLMLQNLFRLGRNGKSQPRTEQDEL